MATSDEEAEKIDNMFKKAAMAAHDDEIVFYKASKQTIEEDHGDHI